MSASLANPSQAEGLLSVIGPPAAQGLEQQKPSDGYPVMAFVIRFATRSVEIWLKRETPLTWGPQEDAKHYRTEAEAHRVIIRLRLSGVTIQELDHARNVVRLPSAP